MFRIDDWSKLAKYCFWISAVAFALYWRVQGPGTFSEYVRGLTISISIALGVMYFYGKWLWVVLWRIIPKLNEWVFPNLNGRWEGVVYSNWPVVRKRLPEYAGNESTDLSEHAITLDIRQTLFSIHITTNSGEEANSSETIVVIPAKDKVSGVVTLHEIFRARRLVPKDGDSGSSLGAGTLTYRKNDKSEELIEGHFWTERNWRDGLNTAGSISVTKTKKQK